MFISSNSYDNKFQEIAGRILPNQGVSSTYNSILPIKNKNFSDYTMENKLKPNYSADFRKYPISMGFLPSSQNPIVERVFRPSVVDDLHSKQLLITNKINHPDSFATQQNIFPPVQINNNLGQILKETRKNSKVASVKKDTPRETSKHDRKKSNSYHFESNSKNHRPSYVLGPPPFIGPSSNPYINGQNGFLNGNKNYPNNFNNNFMNNANNPLINPYDSNYNNFYNNLNNQNAFANNSSMNLGGNSYENEGKMLEMLMEKEKRKKEKRIKAKNEEYNNLLQNMMKKQSDLLKRLVEVRDDKRKKREEIDNEALRNKISHMESQMMFKKFEGDQMNFLLELKNDIKNKLDARKYDTPDYVNPDIFRNMQKNMIFNAMSNIPPPPTNSNPTMPGFLPPMNILDI